VKVASDKSYRKQSLSSRRFTHTNAAEEAAEDPDILKCDTYQLQVSKMSKQDSQQFSLRKILVPVDGSENSKRAARAAIEIAKRNQAELVMVNVVSIPTVLVSTPGGVAAPSVDYGALYEAGEIEGKRIVQNLVDMAKNEGVKARGEVLRSVTSTVDEIVKNAENEKVDMIVIGTRGLGGFRRLLLGSVSSGVVTHAHCAVLVVR
jgi:nucleotide-binding universal stress UspA family protein